VRSEVQPWRWRQNISPKRWSLPRSLHDGTSQKNNVVILWLFCTDMRLPLFWSCNIYWKLSHFKETTEREWKNYVRGHTHTELLSEHEKQPFGSLRWRRKYSIKLDFNGVRKYNLYWTTQVRTMLVELNLQIMSPSRNRQKLSKYYGSSAKPDYVR
jgi:hypothetical protein